MSNFTEEEMNKFTVELMNDFDDLVRKRSIVFDNDDLVVIVQGAIFGLFVKTIRFLYNCIKEEQREKFKEYVTNSIMEKLKEMK